MLYQGCSISTVSESLCASANRPSLLCLSRRPMDQRAFLHEYVSRLPYRMSPGREELAPRSSWTLHQHAVPIHRHSCLQSRLRSFHLYPTPDQHHRTADVSYAKNRRSRPLHRWLAVCIPMTVVMRLTVLTIWTLHSACLSSLARLVRSIQTLHTTDISYVGYTSGTWA